MFIIPENKFMHPENTDRIYEALEEFYSTDCYIEGEFEEMRDKVIEVLKDEPEILAMIKDDLEDWCEDDDDN